MTPQQEKAREIVIKMQFQKEPLMFEQAKQCALIALRETVWGYLDQYPIEVQNYWEEVKQEIEKL
jgi:hypothetical protein